MHDIAEPAELMSVTRHAHAEESEAEARPVGTWRWWPMLAGVGFGVFVLVDLLLRGEHGVNLAPLAAASGLVYLTAAAERPAWSWPAFFATVVVNTITKLGGFEVYTTWFLIGLACIAAGYGLVRARRGLTPQLIAMVVLACVAVIATFVDAAGGAYLVAAALLAHAGWDAYHYRLNRVVPRSMSEFCLVLDVLLALSIVALTV